MKSVKPVMEERMVSVVKGDKTFRELKSKSIIKNTVSVNVKNQDEIDNALVNYGGKNRGNIKKFYLSNI
jgi:hypothetical protein